MGMITDFFAMLFGNNRNVLVETAQVFRENAENAGVRDAKAQSAALQQFAAEFLQARPGLFDRMIDGVNRLPRPLMAFGTLGLLAAAMIEPVWFAARMQGLALVPDPLWWLMGAIVSFYFGARHQAKGQAFQRSVAQTMARTGDVAHNLVALNAVREKAVREAGAAKDAPAAPAPGAPTETAPAPKAPAIPLSRANPALTAWRMQHGT